MQYPSDTCKFPPALGTLHTSNLIKYLSIVQLHLRIGTSLNNTSPICIELINRSSEEFRKKTVDHLKNVPVFTAYKQEHCFSLSAHSKLQSPLLSKFSCLFLAEDLQTARDPSLRPDQKARSQSIVYPQPIK